MTDNSDHHKYSNIATILVITQDDSEWLIVPTKQWFPTYQVPVTSTDVDRC